MEALLARAVQLLVALGGAYMATLWFALVVWTFQDIQARSRSVIAQIFSTLVVVLFFVPGVLIYLILRPKQTLEEAFQRSLEEEYLLQDVEEAPHCPTCQRHVSDDFVFCPYCRTELRQSCPSCKRLIDLDWEICAYCGAEQYPESVPAYGREWSRAPAASAGRFIGQARERINGRWSRERAGAPAGRVAGDEETSVWHPGNGGPAYADPWDGVEAGGPVSDRTEELPTAAPRSQP